MLLPPSSPLLYSYNSSNSPTSSAPDQRLPCAAWEFACSMSAGARQLSIQPPSSQAWEFHVVDAARPRQFAPMSENGSDCVRTSKESSAWVQTGLLCLKARPTTWDISRCGVSTEPFFKLVNYSLLHLASDGWMLVIQHHLSRHYLLCSEYPKEMYFNWYKFMFLCWLGNELTDKLRADL